MNLEIPQRTLELKYNNHDDEEKSYLLDGWDYDNNRLPTTKDALVALCEWTGEKPALIAPKVIGGMARRLKEISDKLGLGPLEI